MEDIEFVDYTDESMLSEIQSLVSMDLSEPYSIFTYRYFIHNWPQLCVCVYSKSENGERKEMIGTIVCKGEEEGGVMKGYVAMLAVNKLYRKRGIGQQLASLGVQRMVNMGCKEIVLEAELTNHGAIALYQKIGFMKEEKLSRYYLNGGDAYRLKLFVDRT